MVTPVETPAAARAHATFMALLWALSNPGRVETLPVSSDGILVTVAEALIDLETTFYTPNETLARRLALTGARPAVARLARYHFYPAVGKSELDDIGDAPTGTYSYPDDSATMVVACRLLDSASSPMPKATRIKMTGPGISGKARVDVSDLPADLWAIRAEAIRYPLGWDLILVSDDRVVGVPRTTVVEVLE
jgi:alpha-D-ribose 1-methylphosphonate 5-triphosphate synthase subunit PhnH